MNCPGEQLLARTAGSFDQDGAVALSNLRQNLEEAGHGWAAADDVLERVPCRQLLLKLLDLAEVLKGLHAPNSGA